MKITFIVLLVVVIMCVEVSCQQRHCSKDEAMQAESSIKRFEAWDDLYQSFKRFSHCDDGAIAEGYSDSVVHLLSSRWDQLQELSKLSSSDKKFLDFVIRHIDATVDERELENVLINSEKHCPKSARTLCSMIEKAAKKAWAEMHTQGK